MKITHIGLISLLMALSLALLPSLPTMTSDASPTAIIETMAEEKSSTWEIEKESWIEAMLLSQTVDVSPHNAFYVVDNFHPQPFEDKLYKPPIFA